MDHIMKIPIIDFERFNFQKCSDFNSISESDLEQISGEIYKAFSTVGFLYLKNHGVQEDKVTDVITTAKKFFSLPFDVKEKYKRETNHGWVKLEQERLEPTRPGDLKEAFNITPIHAEKWPNDEVPDFQKTVMDFFSTLNQIAFRILRFLAIALKLQDREYFVKNHTGNSMTTLRCLRYPPLPPSFEIKPNQIRCGTHSDYGSITLLFQDDVGGLELRALDGSFYPATPIPGTLLVNIGDAMQRWTSDQLVSTRHRVLIPQDEEKRNRERFSLAFFCEPNNDCLIECLDGSNKYEPILARDHLQMKFKQSYGQ